MCGQPKTSKEPDAVRIAFTIRKDVFRSGASRRNVPPALLAACAWLERNWPAILAFLAAVMACLIAIAYAKQPLLEAYSFRQTQTALTSYWMIKEGWRLAYQTPVLGYPWSIPFEFPLFQSLAALLSRAGGFPLDETGRLLSFAFLLACGWPAFLIARRLDLPPQVAFVFCAFFWSSPAYLFVGRTFMIETIALFFTLMAIPYALDLRRPEPTWPSVLLFALFATLGMLQKVTTAAPVLTIMGLIVLASHIKASRVNLPTRRRVLCIAAAFGTPLLLGALWVKYTDAVKLLNAYGAEETSEALVKWNLGTLAQRFDPHILKMVFWDRTTSYNAGGTASVLLLAGALVSGDRRTRTILLVSLVLFALPFFMFANLYRIHEYYQSASEVFIIAALAVAIVMWLPKLTVPAVAPIIAALFVFWNLASFTKTFEPLADAAITPANSTVLAVSDVLRRYTPPDSAIVVYGMNWNSAIPYYSQRKALTAAKKVGGAIFYDEQGNQTHKTYPSAWREPQRYLGDLKMGALVFCPTDELSPEEILSHPEVRKNPALFAVGSCYIDLPGVKSITVENRIVLPETLPDPHAADSGPVRINRRSDFIEHY